MMRRQTRPPSAFLQPYISHFELRDLVVLETRGIRPLPARPAQFLIFHLADTKGSDLFDYRTGEIAPTPPVGIQGPQSFRAADALWKGRFKDFAVAFRPTGFHQLFGIPMDQVTDRVIEASNILGAGVVELHERLQAATGLDAMALLAEEFFRRRLPSVGPFHPVQLAASQIIARNGRVTIDDLARNANLSGRQLERSFIEHVGMPPKLYSRISRLAYALRLKEATPSRTWTELTYLAGYFDQNHMIKDFKALAGNSPSNFFRLIEDGFKTGRTTEIQEMSVSY